MFKPGFKYEIIDNSRTPVIAKPESHLPLFLLAFSADKGPEDMMVVNSENFFNLFGTDKNYFAKHGQPLLQAATIVEAGGTVLAKRVVAEDSTLANITIVAKVQQREEQKRNAEGELIYVDSSGHETTEVDGNTPVMITKCVIKYEPVYTASAKSINEVVADTEQYAKDSEFPIFTIMDNGRGLSKKKIRISPDYTESRRKEYMKYSIDVIEDNTILETLPFCFDPDISESNVNRSLQNVINKFSSQLKCRLYEDQVFALFEKVASIAGESAKYYKDNDILFGKERKAIPMTNIEIDLTSEDNNLSYIYGLELKEGSNGEFGDAPFGKPQYNKALINFFNGKFDDKIYDVDNYKIDLIVDANYPAEVKREIEKLVTFREDLFYIRDLGIGLRTIEDILAADADSLKNKFCASYLTSYDVIDPYTRKQIPVTIGYSMSKLLVNHFNNGRTRPLAGELYNMVLSDAIEGTVNFIPKVTPSYDQKEQLLEARINYASYFDNKLVLETLFTSQELETQFSYINNVLAVQEIIKALRTRCPKTRYSFIDGEDLETYKEDVNTVLNKYASNFKTLKMVYLQDPTMVSNNVFYAAIEVTFRNFVQTEYFKIYALS